MATTSAIYNVNEDFFRSGAGTTKPNGTTDTTEAVARPGNLGLGIADPSTLAGKLDISGAQILVVRTVPSGSVVEVTGCNEDCSWYRVQGGWICADLIRVIVGSVGQ